MREQFWTKPNPYFPRLFEPGYVGQLRVKNRIVMPPMGTQLASDTGAPTDRMIRHYVRRAEGGVGLIIVEFTCVDYPRGKGHACQLALHDDKLISSHNYLVETVHQAGAKISIQLHHAGGNTITSKTEGLELIAPGLIPSRPIQEQPRILQTTEIFELIEKFAQAARRAKLAGYDSVELHGAHGYLLAEFMSTYINTRTDEWGGSLENRMRFPLAVIGRAKELVGEGFPISMRISGVEQVAGGRQIEETVQIAKILEAAGVAALHISAGIDTDFDWAVDPIYAPQGRKVPLAAAVKGAVGIPVITVGVIREPSFAEAVLREGKADFVAIGRGLLADPDWPKKAAGGRPETIRRCFSCNFCDGTRNPAGMSVRCVVNLELGQGDSAWDVKPASKKKRVMVIGGGPAGIEVSRIAALRGHDVTLFERRDVLGGQLFIAAKVPGKDKINWLIGELIGGFASAGAKAKLNSEVTGETISSFSPDVVVLATGGEPLIPDIPGVDGPGVTTAWSVIDGKVPADAKRFIVVGGSATGCEAAIYLAAISEENEIILMEQMSELASDMEQFARQATRRHIAEAANIQTRLGWRVTEITAEGAIAHDFAGERRLVDADAVVLAVGVRPSVGLLGQLSEAPGDVYTIGDCSQPGTIASALRDARVMGALI